jgi:two-component system, OmpR family, heavy metal sensor histidine kinase CusS
MRDAFEALADERGVQILSEGDAALQVDPMLLRRALHNLIANALAHTPRGGTVTLSAGRTAQGVEVAVADNGTGIGEQHLPLLFDRFYRADASRSSSENSGLGLAIVKSIAELHGGAVSVSSTVGHGARFVIRLPADAGKSEIAGPAAP